MAESKVNLGSADAVERDLRGMADTELAVDLIGYGDDAVYGLAERGLRAMQRDTEQGELWKRIRNLGADVGPTKSLPGLSAMYNAGKKRTHTFSTPGSRGFIEVPPGGIITNPNVSKGVIRHELAHHGFETLRSSMGEGENAVPVPMDALSRILEKDDSSDAEHLLIESLDASVRLKTGEKLSEELQAAGRAGFDDIARYMNEPSEENRDQALYRIQRALSKPLWSNHFDQTVYKTAKAMLKEDGALNREASLDSQILPYQILDSLMQASMNFNTKPDAGYADGGIVSLPVDNKMVNPEILSQIERIMGR